MKLTLLFSFVLLTTGATYAQELFVNTEPASNIAAHSVGIRLENQGYFVPTYKNRNTIEVMYGASKNLMIHGSLYRSDYYQQLPYFEGGSTYIKYRFLSLDSVQSFFRGAFFIKASRVANTRHNQEIALEGDNSGIQGGLIFTKLIHKLALSGSASYLHVIYNNIPVNTSPLINANSGMAYTLSAGYLLLPTVYESYDQININLYLELLGKSNIGYNQNYLDIAPSVQFIFSSVFRVDLSYRAPLFNNMTRNSGNAYLIRAEYDLFSIF